MRLKFVSLLHAITEMRWRKHARERKFSRWCSVVLFLGATFSGSAAVDTEVQHIGLAYLRLTPAASAQPLRLKKPPLHLGIDGARLAIDDSNTTGRFTQQVFSLDVIEGDAVDLLITGLAHSPKHYSALLVDLPTAPLQTLLKSLPEHYRQLVINVGNQDDKWRTEQCQYGLLHTATSRAMLADGLGQYLLARRWQRWFMVYGDSQDDLALKAAYERTGQRFGGKWDAQKAWQFDTDMRRTVQQDMPLFTQSSRYDVVIVADEAQSFAQYLPYSTWLPRPVAGNAGMSPVAWHWTFEQWGAVQLQNRFFTIASRAMTSMDYAAWVAVRSVAEAATRTRSVDAQLLYRYLLSEDFELAAFKGRKLSFRQWNGQLRQPIAVVHPQGVVTQSPQNGFLHPVNELDTLGYDKPEVQCSMKPIQE